mmetsp:Transcript_35936/g.65984  ORF Transcript_35936/g.65984 Transcript_35936/m.65984 type:complete len:227 (-) Transcript_35936:866-1546(-)
MSPRMDFLLPVKENIGSGTGIGTLTPTCPACISLTYLRAAAPLLVKTAVPFPYGFEFTNSMASSYVSTSTQQRTGPKSSFSYMDIPFFTPENTEGASQLPSFKASGTDGFLPSTSSFAPSSIPACMNFSILSCACFEINGPRSALESVPSPTLRLLAPSATSGIISLALPTKTATLIAMHLCPAAPQPAPVSWFTTLCGSASGKTTAWFFAPRLHCARLPFLPALV